MDHYGSGVGAGYWYDDRLASRGDHYRRKLVRHDVCAGMSAQMTAAVSIGLASYTGTCQFLLLTYSPLQWREPWSLMAAGLRRKTVTSILMARVFTLPAAIILSGVLYWLS
ncbi:hypothetical protein KCP70_09890 [Salmonella enterica subsp. enterica]|nr:hypothetical protein KCP70_09890 [Salmonella enterica subsp. enterica]